MPSTHRFVAEWSPERFERRAAKVGPATQTSIHAVLSARKVPEQSFRSCLGPLELARSVGNHGMEAAARRANRFGICSYTAVKRILDKGLEAQPLDALMPINQPGIIFIPLSFIVLVVVSPLIGKQTSPKPEQSGDADSRASGP